MNYWNSMAELWQRGMAKFLFNKEFEPVATPAPDDRRFKDDAWAENVILRTWSATRAASMSR